MTRRVCAAVAAALLAGGLAAQEGAIERATRAASEGRLPEALSLLDAEIEGNGSAEAQFVKGVVLARSGREAEAEEIFLELTRSHPDYPEPFNNLAVLYAERGEYERAVEILKLALATHSSYGTAYDNLTKVYGKLASRAYDRALGQESSDGTAGPDLRLLGGLESGSDGGEAVPQTAAPSSGRVAVKAPLTERVAPAEPLGDPTPTGGQGDASGPAADEPRAQFDAAAVAGFVRAWAQAWSDQDVNAYLGYYSPDFSPADRSRAEWERQRRQRIEGPRFIEVAVESIAVRPAGSGRVQVRFLQRYRSDSFQDTVVKVLDLVRSGDSWRIDAEESTES